VTLYDAAGRQLASERMPARTADDIALVLPRLAQALLSDQTVDETLTLDNATRAETQVLPQRHKVEKNFGPLVGVLISTDTDVMPTMPLIGIGARFEFGDVMAEAAGGMAIHGRLNHDDDGDGNADDDGSIIGSSDRDDEQSPLHLFLNISAAYYLTHTSVAPYIGGGLGFFLGERLHHDTDGDDTGAGIELFPLLGIELMRSTRIRLHLDARYSFNVDAASGDWGHGPGVLAGVNF
jgi:hypothetical protein